MKDVHHFESLGKYKLKPSRDTSTHLLEWLKLNAWKAPSSRENVGLLELSHIRCLECKPIDTLKHCLAIKGLDTAISFFSESIYSK